MSLCNQGSCCAPASQYHIQCGFGPYKLTRYHTLRTRDRILITNSVMQLTKFQDIFASKEFVSSLSTPTKSVRFAPETNFTSGRPNHHFARAHPQYVPGKHSCPEKSGGEWENTSKMNDAEYDVLHMVVHTEHRVRDHQEALALSNSFHLLGKSGLPLQPGSEIPLHLSKFKNHVLECFCDKVTNSADAIDEVKCAKVIVVYKNRDGKFIGFEFHVDTQEELEAVAWVRELKNNIPPDNVGIQRPVMLRLLQEAWLSEVCDTDTTYR
jgi:hypothetical protein